MMTLNQARDILVGLDPAEGRSICVQAECWHHKHTYGEDARETSFRVYLTPPGDREGRGKGFDGPHLQRLVERVKLYLADQEESADQAAAATEEPGEEGQA